MAAEQKYKKFTIRKGSILEEMQKKDERFMNDVDALKELANTSQMVERWQEAADCMAALVHYKLETGSTVEEEERKFLVDCFKSLLAPLRSSWRKLMDEKKGDAIENSANVDFLVNRIEEEVKDQCMVVIDLFEGKVKKGLPRKQIKNKPDEIDQKELKKIVDNVNDKTPDATWRAWIFYLKTCGDYWRYIAESTLPNADQKKFNKNKATEMYKAAMTIAEKKLVCTHPLRLGLVLNYSVCTHDLFGDKEAASEMAKNAFDEAIQKLDTLNDSTYKNSTTIMQLLRDNLTIWSADDQNKGGVAD